MVVNDLKTSQYMQVQYKAKYNISLREESLDTTISLAYAKSAINWNSANQESAGKPVKSPYKDSYITSVIFNLWYKTFKVK